MLPADSRTRKPRKALGGARDGTIDLVVSDHSPCPPDMKLPDEGDFMKAWGGIASLQFRLPVIWTEANGAVSRLKTWFDGCAANRAASWSEN